MTAEKLQDAITLLPADLIAEADQQRRAPRQPIRWQRYAAMAASLALVLFGSIWCLQTLGTGGAKETAAEAPAAMQSATVMETAPEKAVQGLPETAPEAAPKEESAALDISEGAGSVNGSNSTGCYASSVLTVTFHIDGVPHELEETDQATVKTMLLELDYSKDLICECIAEITIVIGEKTYSLNLDEGFIRGPEGQAILTKEQTDTFWELLARLENS